MKFVCERTLATGEIRFEGSFTVDDLAKLRFDGLDRMILGESLEGRPASDFLLVLERIYRKHEEQTGSTEK